MIIKCLSALGAVSILWLVYFEPFLIQDRDILRLYVTRSRNLFISLKSE
jgi:hypothetical protein